MDRVEVYAPGSASNLGPGFDCLGVAFTGKGDRVSAVRLESGGVRVARVSDARIPTDPARNTAAIAAAAVLKRLEASIGLELVVEKGLPLSGGMGGSAASAVAGAVAAAAILEARLPREELLAAAIEGEKAVAGLHADNVAASLEGGAILVLSLDPLELVTVRVHPAVALVLVTPDYLVETSEARRVLPKEVSRGTAVAQSASLAGLVLGLERADGDLIRASMRDRIAEPARRSLYRGHAEARAAALEAGGYGVSVSGAGPTLLAVTHWGIAKTVEHAMVEGFRRAGVAATAHAAEVDHAGARVIS